MLKKLLSKFFNFSSKKAKDSIQFEAPVAKEVKQKKPRVKKEIIELVEEPKSKPRKAAPKKKKEGEGK